MAENRQRGESAMLTFGEGHRLLSFVVCDEPRVPEQDAGVALTWAVVVVRHGDGRYLLGFNPNRQQWELPGGGIEPHEHPDEAARREVREETGQIVEGLRCRGVFKVRFQPEARCEYGALYTGTVGALRPFTPNQESARIRLWRADEALDGVLSALSRTMMRLVDDLS